MPASTGNLPVVITGIGPVTAIGVGAESFFASISGGSTAIGRRNMLVDLGRSVELPLVDLAAAHPPEMQRALNYLDGQQCTGARDLAYALLAAELAAQDARLDWDRRGNRVGMIQVFEAPGVEATVQRLFSLFQGPLPAQGPPPVYDLLADRFYNMQAFVYVHVLAKALGLHGFCTSAHNACSSGAFAIELAADCIRSGRADVMIVVGGEAFDTAVRLEWFRRLDLYSHHGVMRPFSPEPAGFYVGEGAAAIIIESMAHAEKRGAAPYARYLGGAFAHQGWKQTLPDVASARLADVVLDAASVSGVSLSKVDLVVPHGAGTALSDRYEAECLEKALRSATGSDGWSAHAAVFKPSVGHMLAASGLIEVAAALLCLRHGIVPPCIGGDAESRRFPARFADQAQSRRLRTLLKLSTGFTGHDAAAIFQAC